MHKISQPAIHVLSMSVLLLCGASAAHAAPFFDNGPPVHFTTEQAARGQKDYADNCEMCHGANLNDGEFGPALKGASFKTNWHDQSVEALFSFLDAKMPPNDPGSLDSHTMADIEAYILKANGIEASNDELSAGALVAAETARQSSGGQQLRQFTFGPPNNDATAKATMTARKSYLERLTPVTDQMLAHPADGDWLTWRRSFSSNGYSPLSQVNTGNAAKLRVAWTWALPVSPDETTPLIHDGVLFIKSANQVEALNAATGTLLWKYTRRLPDDLQNGRSAIAKSLALYGDKLFAPTADGHIVALDIRTGKLLWDHTVLGPDEIKNRLRLDGAPLAVKGKVIMGTSSCNTYKGGCFIVGLDADTGKEAWRFHTIARPGQPGGDSWNGAPVDERYGGSVWTSGSYDPDLNLLYWGIGQTYDTSTLLMPQAKKGKSADGLYTDATVALDPDNGKLVWYYQHFNRDVWDFDWVFERTLLRLPVNGKPTNLLVTGGKIAIFDALDRKTGHYEFSVDLGLQNLVSRVDPKTGRKIVNPALRPEADKTKLVCPHPGGARSWPATSYDPMTKILYVPLEESCMEFTWRPRGAAETAAGGSDLDWVLIPRPDSDGKFGRVMAINLETRKVVWTTRQRAPMSSSILTTAGGLAFVGSRDRMFRALDAASGKTLWNIRLDAQPSSTPVSYSVGGRQYIAVVAGGGGAHDVTWPVLTPEINDPSGGNVLWVFEVPDAASSGAAQ